MPRKSTATADADVLVVGSGIGGLTAAALLAQAGYRVCVLEQHYLAGGYCTSWVRRVRNGGRTLYYTFDAGVHDIGGLGPRGTVRLLLRRLGIEHGIRWHRVDREVVLPGWRLQFPRDSQELVGLLGRRFPGERAGIEAFFAEMEALYREIYLDSEQCGGIPRLARGLLEALAVLSQRPRIHRWLGVPFLAMLAEYLRDPELRWVLSAFFAYLTHDPAPLSVVAMAPIYGYFFDGGYYPEGGSQRLADALVGVIERCGGTVRLRSPVSRLTVHSGRVLGVELASGETLAAPTVISNADLRHTFLDLVGRERLPAAFRRRVEALQPSTSGFSVFLGVDYVPRVSAMTLVGPPGSSLFIGVPSQSDPSLAPPGHACITLLTFLPPGETAPWDRSDPGYARRKRAAGDELMSRAEAVLPGLSKHVVYRQDASPATFERYAWTGRGAIYGTAVEAWHPMAETPLDGLYLTGAGTFPGNGIESVVISGVLAAEAVERAVARPGRRPLQPQAGGREPWSDATS
jgi:all-trans-retinol 13,14-reductase